MKLFDDYKNVYGKLEQENPMYNVLSCIDDDLSDKGFSSKEINEIINEQMSESTLYRLGAYLISLFNEPTTLEEWRTSIKEDVKVDFKEEDIIMLWNAYQTINL
jgi:hypothetical protein